MLYSPFSRFGVRETFDFFEALGLPLKIEARQRAFPKTERAEDVVRTLEKYLRQGRVEIRIKTKVKSFRCDGNVLTGLKVGGQVITAESYILATGGKSHPETGSTGDGFGWLKNLGLWVKEPTPTVVPLAIKEPWIKSLAGLTLENIKITFFAEGKKKLTVTGAILCTHFGVSGPTILDTAGQVADLLNDGVVTATIDSFPELNHGALDAHITEIFDQNKNRSLKNTIKFIALPGTGPAILTLLPQIDPEKKIHSITKDERKTIINLLKALPLTVTGLLGYGHAVVADGGLALTEIESKTMRSRKYANLFITGDLLDITRPSGGFSLQLCWTTGWVAGNNA